jgi:hypothetical protein
MLRFLAVASLALNADPIFEIPFSHRLRTTPLPPDSMLQSYWETRSWSLPTIRRAGLLTRRPGSSDFAGIGYNAATRVYADGNTQFHQGLNLLIQGPRFSGEFPYLVEVFCLVLATRMTFLNRPLNTFGPVYVIVHPSIGHSHDIRITNFRRPCGVKED